MPEMIRYLPFTERGKEHLPSVICLGNFDGLHRGHTALIEEAQKISSKASALGQNIRVGALCFDTLSSDYLSASSVPHLMSLKKKLDALRSVGLDCAYVCDFAQIKDLSPTEFIDGILLGECSAIGAVCGFNFRFGRNAGGDADLLVEHLGTAVGSTDFCRIVSPVLESDNVISSSCIRRALSNGDIELANSMLGRKFSISHTVVHGKHLGTRLGFPTLNHIFSKGEIIPAFGIYATKTVINGESLISVTNVGVRPTVSSSNEVTCETHIIGENKSLYGQIAEIFFYTRLRDEKQFDSPEQLSAAIAADVEATKRYFLTYNENED